MESLLKISGLRTYFYTYQGVVKAVDGVSFEVNKNETVGLVGETGCGKSVTALSIMRLIQWPPGKIVGGEIIFKGEDLALKTDREMREIRGNRISMIFQEPMTSLNPVFRVGDQIADVIVLHQKVKRKEALKKAVQMIEAVNIPDPEKVARQYPHELSGGMRQRIVMAIAIACNPDLLIADEPTTFLDVTVQAQILKLMESLRNKVKASMILITHNLGVVAQTCNKVMVMYAGNVVESGHVGKIFENPMHPYTKGLMNAIPKLNEHKDRLEVIKGLVPNLVNPPSGCTFHPRCQHAMEICSKQKPALTEIEENHLAGCYLYH